MDSIQLVAELRGAKNIEEVRNILKGAIPSESVIAQLPDPQKSWVATVIEELQSNDDDDGVEAPTTPTKADEGDRDPTQVNSPEFNNGDVDKKPPQPSPLEDVAQKVIGGRSDASPDVEPIKRREPS